MSGDGDWPDNRIARLQGNIPALGQYGKLSRKMPLDEPTRGVVCAEEEKGSGLTLQCNIMAINLP